MKAALERIKVLRFGKDVGKEGEMDLTGLLERWRCCNRRRRGKFERAEMELSVKSIESSWSLVTPRFSIAGILWPASSRRRTRAATAGRGELSELVKWRQS